jgi:hypothetical protein
VVAIVALVAVVILALFGGLSLDVAGSVIGTVLAAFGLGAAHERAAARNGGG